MSDENKQVSTPMSDNVQYVNHIVAEGVTHTVCCLPLSERLKQVCREVKPSFVMYDKRKASVECPVCYQGDPGDENDSSITRQSTANHLLIDCK